MSGSVSKTSVQRDGHIPEHPPQIIERGARIVEFKETEDFIK
jgi:hypothetical protein